MFNITPRRKENYSQRSFYVGGVKPENILTKFRDGILEIRLPNMNTDPGNKRSIDIQ